MIKQQYYIQLGGSACNLSVVSQPIAVNCAGLEVLDRPFLTDNPRGRNDYYLQYLVRGNMDILLCGEETQMCEGDVVIYTPHTHYRYGAKAPGTCYYWVHFSGNSAASLLADCKTEGSVRYHVGLSDRLTSGFERMFREFITRDDYFEKSLSTTLMRLCIDIARIRSNHDAQKRDARIDRILSQMHLGYANELSIAALAKSEFLSEGRLRTMFRERFGMSPQRYLTALRISSAKQLLEQPDIPVAEVARSVGIADPLYFSRVFRQHTGVSPSEYRSNK